MRFAREGADVIKIVTTSSQLQMYRNVDREQGQTFPEWEAKSAQIHRHLLRDKALAGTVHKRLASRVAVELRVETNNVRLSTCFQKA